MTTYQRTNDHEAQFFLSKQLLDEKTQSRLDLMLFMRYCMHLRAY